MSINGIRSRVMDDIQFPPGSGGGNVGNEFPSMPLPKIGPDGVGVSNNPPRPQYSMTGILHFLQTEWARFEIQRAQWEVERAELQARIAFLEGERRGQENLKRDLVRRIKMLEFALKQERVKFHKLKYGTDLNFGDIKSDMEKENLLTDTEEVDALLGLRDGGAANTSIREGRQLLRQYLKEVGYTDSVLQLRAARVRQLLGLPPDKERDQTPAGAAPAGASIQTSRTGSRIAVPGSALVNGDALAAAIRGVNLNANAESPSARVQPTRPAAPSNLSPSRRTQPAESLVGSARDASGARPPAVSQVRATESNIMRQIERIAAASEARPEAERTAASTSPDQDNRFEEKENALDGLSTARTGAGEAGAAFEANEAEPEAEEAEGADAETEQALAEFDFLVQQQDQERAPAAAAAAAAAADENTPPASSPDAAAAAAPAAAAAAPAATGAEADSFTSLDALDQVVEKAEGDLTAAADVWPVDETLLNSLKEQYKRDRVKRAMGTHLKASPAVAGTASLDAVASGVAFDAPMGNNEVVDEMAIESGLPPKAEPEADELGSGVQEQEQDSDTGLNSAQAALSALPGDTQLGVSGLGELADLAMVTGASGDLDSLAIGAEAVQGSRRMWAAKYTLRSHFDGVRHVLFHPLEPVVFTASEDHTIKLWHLNRTLQSKKNTTLDVEPIYTLRGHRTPVLSMAINQAGSQLFSSSLDGTIRTWNLPSLAIDPYDPFDPNVYGNDMVGHSDAVWSLAMHPLQSRVLSCSADQTVRLWTVPSGDRTQPQPQEEIYTVLDADELLQSVRPTSVTFVQPDSGAQFLVTLSSGILVLVDTETRQPIQRFGSPSYSYVYRAAVQPSAGLCITAHEDKHMRFWDLSSGRLVHAVVAHQDAVTSLAVDTAGLHLLSGSHDCSVRLWNLETRTCSQEITAHRRKHLESIHDVAFHPTRALFASAGADALAKVFQAGSV